MTLPPLLQRYRSRIERGLREGLQGETRVAEMLRYHLGIENGDDDGAASMGKLLRPSLVLFTAEQLGEAPDHALPAAIGLELIHNFSLIHDDIQDHDETRRGRPTVWCRYGVAQAINAGDAMQVLAVRHALDAGEAAAGILLEATWEMIEGQSLDLALEGRPASADAYLSMIDRKTGALLRCALRLGGTLAGAEPEVLLALAAAGTELGRAFQIHDDLLGIWGNGATTGKPQGSDIRRRKRTLPIAGPTTIVAASSIASTRRRRSPRRTSTGSST
jgi:geranylgeranyl diphosphate synthase type I